MLVSEVLTNFIFHIFQLEKPELVMMPEVNPMCMSCFCRTITFKLQGKGGRVWQRWPDSNSSRGGGVGKRFLVWDDRSSLRGVWRNLFGTLKRSACLGIKSLHLHPLTTTTPFGLVPTKICEGFQCSIPLRCIWSS